MGGCCAETRRERRGTLAGWNSARCEGEPCVLGAAICIVGGGGGLKSRRNKKFECDVCGKVIIGEEQWDQHLKGRVHKRHVEGLKRKKQAEKYFEEKRRKESEK